MEWMELCKGCTILGDILGGVWRIANWTPVCKQWDVCKLWDGYGNRF